MMIIAYSTGQQVVLVRRNLAFQHGCSELETRLRIKNIRYGLLTQLLMSSLSQSFYQGSISYCINTLIKN